MSEAGGYILRIATKQWVNQVFDMAIYYTSIHRKWKAGQTMLFMHKTGLGDAIIGYGVIENVHEKDELSETERQECEKGDWKRAIEFRYVKQFGEPLPIKQTFLKGSKLRGRYFHGLRINDKQLEAVITQAENR
jgi:hypothetical protein